MLVLGYTGVLSVPLRVDGVGAVPCRVTRVAAAEAREQRSSSGTTLSIRTRPRARASGPERAGRGEESSQGLEAAAVLPINVLCHPPHRSTHAAPSQNTS